MEDLGLTIAEAAERTGLTTHTLRYYERAGLMLDVGRSESGHRRYTEQNLAWVGLLTRLRATGMPIRELRRYAQLVRAGEDDAGERQGMLRAHRDRLRSNLAELTAHLDALDRKIACDLETTAVSVPRRVAAAGRR